jgi:BASS family bile acid:Na+ symporter
VFDRVFGLAARIAPTTVAKVVLLTILMPLVAGILARQYFPELAARAALPIVRIATVLLLLAVVPVLLVAWPVVKSFLGNGTVLVLAAVAAFGLAAGHLLGGPDPSNQTVLALSTASRHPAVALAIATAGGAEKKAELAAILLYLIVAGVVSALYTAWRRQQAKRALINPGTVI